MRAGGQDADRCSLVWNEPIQSRPRIAARHSAVIGRVSCFSVRRRERNHLRARHYPCGDVATIRLVWQPNHSPGTAGRGTADSVRLGGHSFQPQSFAKRPPFTSRRKHHVSRIVAAGIHERPARGTGSRWSSYPFGQSARHGTTSSDGTAIFRPSTPA